MQDAKIFYRNFEGLPTKYNVAGQRNFCLLLTTELASVLKADGWNIKFTKPRDDQEDPKPYTQIKVNYDNPRKMPRIVMMNSTKKTLLDKDTVKVLDYVEMVKVDLVVTPSPWDVQGKAGLKGYVKALYVTVADPDFEGRYEDVPGAQSPQEDDA